MATYQLRRMSIGEILDGAFAIYRGYFATLVAIAVVCEGVPAILNTYITLGGGAIEYPVLWLATFVLSGLGGLVAAAATVWIISEAYLGRDATVGDGLSYALGKMVPLFVAGLAKYLLITLGIVLFFFPAIVIACGYAVVAQIVVLEDLPAATDALRRSWVLTRGHKRRAFVLGVVVFAIIWLPFMIAGALALYLPFLEYVFTVGGQLLQLVVYPLVACAFTLFYYDLRVRKEAFDLDHLSRQIGLTAEPTEA